MEYRFFVEQSDNAGEWPYSVYVKKINIDEKGYEFAEGHAKTLKLALKKACDMIVSKED